MKKILFVAATAAMLMSACSQNEVMDDQSTSNNAIEFGAYTNRATKANGTLVTDNTFPYGGEMGVFAYYTGSAAWSATATPNFMYNQKITKSSEGVGGAKDTYTYSPIKYWPNTVGEKITFFAYYPYAAAGLTWTDHTSPTPLTYSNASKNRPVANLTVQDAAKDQVDFMYAIIEDKEKPEDQTIKFTFNHALTQVNLKAKLSEELAKDNADGSGSNTTVTITAIKLKNIYKSGTMDMAAATPSWTVSGDPGEFNVTLSGANGINITGTTETAVATDNTGTFLMIPQTLKTDPDAAAGIEVTYKVKTIDASLKDGYSEITNTKTATITGAWAANSRILYTITLSLDQVKVDAEPTPWADETSGNLN